MDLRNSVVDVSSFFLVEASGDSEADSDPVFAIGHDILMASDDAESCSCDSSCDALHEFNGFDDQEYVDCGDHDADDNDGDDYDCSDQNWACEKMGLLDTALAEGDQESGVGDYASREMEIEMEVEIEMVSETEKNRLFWETCLALGYP